MKAKPRARDLGVAVMVGSEAEDEGSEARVGAGVDWGVGFGIVTE